MAHVQVHADDIDLESPVLVEGLPGAGLVGKIAADHLVEEFDMDYYGAVRCEGLPEVAVYEGEQSDIRPPVRLYADGKRDLLVLQSDVPVSPTQASGFATCITGWIEENDVFPLYLSGLPEEKNNVPDMYGVATGDGHDSIEAEGIVPPREGGIVTGPTGALLHHANEADIDSVGLIVQTEAKFPDPEAARVLLEHGIEPIADIDVDTDALLERADEIQEAREELAQRLHEADEESTQAQPIRGFQ
jgi:uncharacterized protein